MASRSFSDQILAFRYLAAHKQNSFKEELKAFERTFLHNAVSLNPEEFCSVLAAYAQFSQFFDDSLKTQRKINSALNSKADILSKDEQLRALLKYYSALGKDNTNSLTLLLNATFKKDSKFSDSCRIECLLIVVERTQFPLRQAGDYLEQLCRAAADLRPEIVIRLAYLVFSDLLDRRLAQTKQIRKARYTLSGGELDESQFQKFTSRLQAVRAQHKDPIDKRLKSVVKDVPMSSLALLGECESMSEELLTLLEARVRSQLSQLTPAEVVVLCKRIKKKAVLEMYLAQNKELLSPKELAFIQRHIDGFHLIQ